METKVIDEQLEDKQQIVTYKYLTNKLNIHPNQAKQILNDYVSKLDGNKKYSTTKVIGGILQDSDEFCIVLVYDDHVETIRRRFKQISFEHLYSIQPISNRLSDINNSLCLIDNSYVNLSSSIKKKKNENIQLQKQNEMEIDILSIEKTSSAPDKILNYINNKIIKTKTMETQKKNIELDISTKIIKKNSTPEKSQKKEINSSNKKIDETKKNDHSNFFTKFKKSYNSINTISNSAYKIPKENIMKDKNKNLDRGSPLKNVEERSINENQITNKHIDKEYPKSNVKQNLINKCQEKDGKKLNKTKEYKNKNNIKVKRKRIQTFDSSDEEEIDVEEEDKKRSEHMDIDDEVDIVQPTPPRPTPREYRKKEKKVTTSTFIDDDGFVCTTKEVQFVEIKSEPSTETVAENVENSKPTEINIEIANKKIQLDTAGVQLMDKKKNIFTKQSKNSSSQGMKQSSLTSFFKTK